eukprot:3777701-Rhodomonas_salina.2
MKPIFSTRGSQGPGRRGCIDGTPATLIREGNCASYKQLVEDDCLLNTMWLGKLHPGLPQEGYQTLKTRSLVSCFCLLVLLIPTYSQQSFSGIQDQDLIVHLGQEGSALLKSGDLRDAIRAFKYLALLSPHSSCFLRPPSFLFLGFFRLDCVIFSSTAERTACES